MNGMCKNCLRLNNGCSGTTNDVYTGCVYRCTTQTAVDQQNEFLLANNENYKMICKNDN